ncbi:hypothetical protein HMPREF0620_1156 [Parascardovia denticolens DSM 10105 = JCM 12538]|uniref:Uncharacterized protein n=1 Tax=Parascardovia denticolens DSM 10105 = JCM 12538 TaxID=864564 RepID=E6K039_PARDN|nr:hypothetical protein HMPREF0620_1156 [Parascardovia denticolens DSM 10105 = JCM 12538]
MQGFGRQRDEMQCLIVKLGNIDGRRMMEIGKGIQRKRSDRSDRCKPAYTKRGYKKQAAVFNPSFL